MDPYALLGVSPDASPEEIKAAYRAAVKRHHPDAGGDPEMARRVTEAWERINAPRTDEPTTQHYSASPPPGPSAARPAAVNRPPLRTTPTKWPFKRMLAVGVVVSLVVIWIGNQSPSEPPPADQLKTAAQRVGRALFTYDANTIVLLPNAVAAVATKEYAAEFRAEFEAGRRNELINNKARSEVTSVAVSHESMSGISGTAYVEVFTHQRDAILGDVYRTHDLALGFKREANSWRLDAVRAL